MKQMPTNDNKIKSRALTLAGHLKELRQRIIISLSVIFVFMVVFFSYAADILTILKLPLSGTIDRLVFISPAEAFSAHIKIAFFSALAAAFPIILLQAWSFVTPALDANIRKLGAILLFFSVLAFFTGVCFGYFILLPSAIHFLIGFSAGALVPMITVTEYLLFVVSILAACGLFFLMPVSSFLLTRIGLLDYRWLRRSWKYAVVVMLIAASVLTPTPDVFNMCLMALPMLILYEISIWVAKLSARKIPSG